MRQQLVSVGKPRAVVLAPKRCHRHSGRFGGGFDRGGIQKAAAHDNGRTRAYPLSIAKRYVAEGQHHIAVQLVRLAQLDRDGHAKLAAKTRDLLDLLESSLRMARQCLARVERESEAGGYGPS